MEQKYREIVDFLHEQGIDQYVELPQIAVLGNTSSGKSSLLTAISKVQFPSNNELTTRCPTRLRMEKSSNGMISASVDIRWHPTSTYMNKGEPFKKISFEGPNSLIAVESAIRQAQDFIITRSSKKIASDIIEINVSSPESVDLTLVDLPGIVRTVGAGEDASMIGEIDALLQEYFNQPLCILLLVIPATEDFHNCQVLEDAKKVDPNTERTLPVITKPDRIDPGAEQTVLDLFLGKKTNTFLRGFHVVKCRGQQELNDGRSVCEGLKTEKAFFESTAPWKDIKLRSTLGIPALSDKLANLQITMLKETIPNILTDINEQLKVATDELMKMGADSTTPQQRRLLWEQVRMDIAQSIDRTLQGSNHHRHNYVTNEGFSLFAQTLKLQDEFGANILKTTLAAYDHPTVDNAVIVNDKTPRGKPGILEEFLADGKNCHVTYEGDNYELLHTVPIHLVKADHSETLKQEIIMHRNHNIPFFLNATIFEKVIGDLVTNEWKPLTLGLLENVHKICNDYLIWVMDTFSEKQFPALHRWLNKTIQEQLASIKTVCLEKVEDTIQVELLAYTNNHYLFENVFKQRNQKLLDSIEANTAQDGNIKWPVIRALFEANQNMGCTEHCVREMQLMITSYGKVAAKRFADTIPQVILSHFFLQLKAITTTTNNCSDVDLEKMFLQSNVTVMQREHLQQKISRLSAVVNHFGMLDGF